MNKDFLQAILGKSEKRALHDKALLDWDREKHRVLAGLEFCKHSKNLALQERMGTDLSSALCDVFNSFLYFASKVSKRI